MLINTTTMETTMTAVIIIVSILFIALWLVDFVIGIAYFFKRNKTNIVAEDAAQLVLDDKGMNDTRITKGIFVFRYWNYFKRSKTLKLQCWFVAGRRNLYSLITATADAYVGSLISTRDKKRWVIRFAGVLSPFIFLMGIASSLVIWFVMASSISDEAAIASAIMIFSLATLLATFLAARGFVLLKRGVVPILEKEVSKGKIDERDLKSVRFYYNVKIALAVVYMVLQAIRIIAKAAAEAQKNKNNG